MPLDAEGEAAGIGHAHGFDHAVGRAALDGEAFAQAIDGLPMQAVDLDPAAADALMADLLTVTEGRSLLLITHRLAGLESVDEILVMDAGRVIERGTHDELLAEGGRYSNLWWDEMRTERFATSLSLAQDRLFEETATVTTTHSALNDGSVTQ